MSKGISLVPFIANMDKNQKGDEPKVKKITKNGEYDTLGTTKIIVKVEGSTPTPKPEPTGEISITKNGIVDVKAYAIANVNVPSIEPTGVLDITENGEYDVSLKAGVNVNVPTGPELLTPNCEMNTSEWYQGEMPISYDANGWSIKWMQGDSNYVYDFLKGINGALTRKDGTLVVSSTGVIQPGYGEGTTLKLILPILSPVSIKNGSSIGAFIIGDASDYDQKLLNCNVEFYTMDNVKIGDTMVLENCFGAAGC